MKLIVMLMLFSFNVMAQRPEPGEVLADSNFFCVDRIESDALTFGIKEICDSENYIEIRLKTSIMATSELIIFSFNKNEWVAEKYYPEYITKRKKVISIIPKKDTKKDSSGLFNTIFDSLKSNKLFLVYEQRQLKERLAISDGILYSFTFKVGNLYRRYYYGNPEAHAEYYPLVPEYKQITNIITLLNGIF